MGSPKIAKYPHSGTESIRQKLKIPLLLHHIHYRTTVYTQTVSKITPIKKITIVITKTTDASANKKSSKLRKLLVAPPGLEPRNTEPKSGVLPITLWGCNLWHLSHRGRQKTIECSLWQEKTTQSFFSLPAENAAT